MKKKEIEDLKRTSKFLYEKAEEYRVENVTLKLKIKELKQFIDLQISPMQYGLEMYTKQIRHQVCERIRDFAEQAYDEFGVFDEIDLVHILDQIEKGE